MSSYSGDCLFVDLTAQRAQTRPLPESLLAVYAGGSALGTRLLLEAGKARSEPLGAGNALVFACGALTGTMAPASSGHAVATKSPLTGFLAETASFGGFSLALRRAGFKAMVITGVSPSPVYLIVDDARVHFIKADHLKGKNTVETAAAIRRTMGDLDVEVASIGPAGENMVRYATIEDGGYLPKRGGAGAVMGSKNLKAIAVRGTNSVPVANLPALTEFCLEFYARCRTNSVSRQPDTAACLLALDHAHALAARNFQERSFEGAASLSQSLSGEDAPAARVACPTCPVACGQVYKNGTEEIVLDCQVAVSLGPLCGIASGQTVLQAAKLCQLYGLDPVSCGASIAWAMEGTEKGILGGLDVPDAGVRFGDDTAMIRQVKDIAYRRGLGDLLAEGTRMAAVKTGQSSGQWAMNVEGMEISPCGFQSAEAKSLEFALEYMEQRDDLAAALDSLMICRSAQPCFRDLPGEASRLYSMCTGVQMRPVELRELGQRSLALKRAFNLREGWQRSNDSLPSRLFSEDLTRETVEAAIDACYRSRGWTAAGTVPEGVFKELGIEEALGFCRGG